MRTRAHSTHADTMNGGPDRYRLLTKLTANEILNASSDCRAGMASACESLIKDVPGVADCISAYFMGGDKMAEFAKHGQAAYACKGGDKSACPKIDDLVRKVCPTAIPKVDAPSKPPQVGGRSYPGVKPPGIPAGEVAPPAPKKAGVSPGVYVGMGLFFVWLGYRYITAGRG